MEIVLIIGLAIALILFCFGVENSGSRNSRHRLSSDSGGSFSVGDGGFFSGWDGDCSSYSITAAGSSYSSGDCGSYSGGNDGGSCTSDAGCD
jgi:hypothetical protein